MREPVAKLFAGLDAAEPRVRFGCAKALLQLSGRRPAALAPYRRRLVALLDHPNKIIQWTGIRALGNLAFVTPPKQIALAHPQFADAIARAMLKSERAECQSAECRNVAGGAALQSLDQFFPQVRQRGSVLAMARRQLDNPRPATRRKAAALLRRHAGHA
jgi:hypothetical protein